MTNNPPNPKVALVTGASTGIGAYTAAALAEAGWRVFGTSRQPEENLARVEDGRHQRPSSDRSRLKSAVC